MDLVLTGVKEIDAVLRQMPTVMNHRVIGAANAEAAKPLVDLARQLAPKKEYDLANSIAAVKQPISRSTNLGEVAVGPRLRRGGYKGHWLEYGTKQRFTKKGAYRGVVTPRPFMRPAFEQTKDLVVSRIREAIGVKLYALMRRVLKTV